jgi:hypothetical protein
MPDQCEVGGPAPERERTVGARETMSLIFDVCCILEGRGAVDCIIGRVFGDYCKHMQELHYYRGISLCAITSPGWPARWVARNTLSPVPLWST